ncbi:Glutathione S-transferase [Quillaja saponaria]|uniref:Glutathione S-transferase n=1 Tax=Quillaja saponaria TaxID=32244 RepID=A0AAD7LM24_QUISA|nr:Glutathione S-transferase [Quillaja saponaria]
MKSKTRLLRNNTMVVKVYGPAYASPKHVLRWRRKLSLRLYLIPIDLFKGEHNDPEFLELQCLLEYFHSFKMEIILYMNLGQ